MEKGRPRGFPFFFVELFWYHDEIILQRLSV